MQDCSAQDHFHSHRFTPIQTKVCNFTVRYRLIFPFRQLTGSHYCLSPLVMNCAVSIYMRSFVIGQHRRIIYFRSVFCVRVCLYL